MKKADTEKKALSLKGSFNTKAFKVGGYSIASVIIVIAIAVAVNLLVGQIPTIYTKFDLTANELFSITEQTKQIVTGLDDNVTVYWMVQPGSEDVNVQELLDTYSSLSNNLRVVKKDPVEYPNFTAQYTAASQNNNDLIIECGERYKFISASDIYEYDYTNYYTDGTYSVAFNGENKLTSAIDYVISDNLPKVYYLTGHGEAELSSDLQNSIKGENIDSESLSLLTLEAVPEDCACLIIYSPASDISENEKDMIISYISGGGTMFLLTDYTDKAMPNLEALMEYYGTKRVDGIVIEGDSNYCAWGMSYYLLPDVNSHDITSPLVSGGYYILTPLAQGIETLGTLRDGVSVTSLLTTSSKAYSKLAAYDMTTYDKEEGDIDGPFSLGVAITDTSGSGEGKIVWLTTSMLLDSQVNSMVSGANEDLFINSIGWMCQRENTISIHSKAIEYDYLTMTSSDSNRWSIVMIGVVPLIFIAMGIYVAVKKRRA